MKVTMNDYQIDNLIEEHFDIPAYDCATDFEDEFPVTLEITGNVDMGKLLKAEKFELMEPNTPHLLNWLCKNGVIEKGTYEII